MNRVPVQSSNVAAVGFDPQRYLLEIEFIGGAVYQIERIPVHIHQGLMDATSKGSFFIRFIRDRYPTVKVADGAQS